MPPLDDSIRNPIEAQLAKEIGKLHGRYREPLQELLGNPPRIENITDDVWDTLIRDFADVLPPPLERAFIEANVALATTLELEFDLTLVNRGAVDWARRYADDTSRGLVSTRRRLIGEWTAQFYENSIDYDEFTDRIAGLFGPDKASQIAQTEITTAAVEGERPVVDELSNQGVALRKYYVTVRDRRVCPICEPLDGLAAVGLGYNSYYIHPVSGIRYDRPPLHTACRCGERYEYENEITDAP